MVIFLTYLFLITVSYHENGRWNLFKFHFDTSKWNPFSFYFILKSFYSILKKQICFKSTEQQELMRFRNSLKNLFHFEEISFHIPF